MSKHSFLGHASQCTYGRFRGRRSTWVAVGTGVLVLVGVLIWSALALTVRGVARQVVWLEFTAQPLWRLADGEHQPDTVYRPSYKFLEV